MDTTENRTCEVDRIVLTVYVDPDSTISDEALAQAWENAQTVVQTTLTREGIDALVVAEQA
jgi:hypothetical protein